MWKIAIIDDDQHVLQGIKRSIPWDELAAEWVGESIDGEQGLELIRNTQPDIVITDIYMPVMNGLDMIMQLRRENYQGKIIILSGYSDFEYARQALRVNVDDYLLKPVTLQTLKEVLHRTICKLEEESVRKLEHEELQRKLMLYEPFVFKEWIKSVVTGTLDSNSTNVKEFVSSKLQWENRSHLVMGIEIIREVQASDVNSSVWNLFRFAVANVIKEVVGEEWPESEFIELHSNHLAVLLHMQSNVTSNEALERARKLADRMTHYVYTYLRVKIKVGIGTLKRKWQEIADSTEEAFYALSTKNLDVALESTNGSTHQLIRPIRFYQQLASAIKHSRELQAKEVIREHMDRLRNRKDVTPTYLHFLGTELWAILAYSLYDVGIFLDEIFPNIDIRKEMNGITKPEQLADWLIEKVQVICGNRQWNENLKHKRVVEFIIQYIHEHYAEDITLNELANQVCFSRNYLGQIFKNATGETFNSYLTKVRMEKAKSMILEGKYLIYEVAGKVGYKNIPYFSTLFKKYTGLNPTDLVK